MRKIIHVDMDCFFAAIEMRDNPELRNLAVAVGGHPDKRGVIATANYKAREFGVRSAMASARAMALCPRLIIVPTNMTKYRAASAKIHAIFEEFTDYIEPLSLDEAFLDVSECEAFRGSATLIAAEIRKRIFETTGLTASAGVAQNKFLAKVASDINKPDGQMVVPPAHVDAFIAPLPVKRIPGVGRVTAEKMAGLGITTCRDLQKWDVPELVREFGKRGPRLYEICRGIDSRPLSLERRAKSISVENTYVEDLMTLDECYMKVPELLEDLERRMGRKKHEFAIKGLFVKVKFSDFRQTTLERTEARDPTEANFRALMREARQRHDQPVRLLGLGVRLFSDDDVLEAEQLDLWRGPRPFLAADLAGEDERPGEHDQE